MIPFASETVTLYNRRKAKDANGRTVVTWHRTVLTGCSWTRRMERVRDGTVMTLAEVTVCKIPEDARYRPPDEWDKIANSADRFTLAPGDIIVRGAAADEIGAAIKATALVDKYRRQGVMTIASAQDNTRPGVPLGHYLARGGQA
jgi:hypothetical protein